MIVYNNDDIELFINRSNIIVINYNSNYVFVTVCIIYHSYYGNIFIVCFYLYYYLLYTSMFKLNTYYLL